MQLSIPVNRFRCRHPRCSGSFEDFSLFTVQEHIALHMMNDNKNDSLRMAHYAFECPTCHIGFVTKFYAINHLILKRHPIREIYDRYSEINNNHTDRYSRFSNVYMAAYLEVVTEMKTVDLGDAPVPILNSSDSDKYSRGGRGISCDKSPVRSPAYRPVSRSPAKVLSSLNDYSHSNPVRQEYDSMVHNHEQGPPASLTTTYNYDNYSAHPRKLYSMNVPPPQARNFNRNSNPPGSYRGRGGSRGNKRGRDNSNENINRSFQAKSGRKQDDAVTDPRTRKNNTFLNRSVGNPRSSYFSGDSNKFNSSTRDDRRSFSRSASRSPIRKLPPQSNNDMHAQNRYISSSPNPRKSPPSRQAGANTCSQSRSRSYSRSRSRSFSKSPDR